MSNRTKRRKPKGTPHMKRVTALIVTTVVLWAVIGCSNPNPTGLGPTTVNDTTGKGRGTGTAVDTNYVRPQ